MRNKKMIKVVESLPKVAPICKCEFCFFMNENDCPRRDEVDEFGDNVRMFATECRYFRFYQDASSSAGLSSSYMRYDRIRDL